MPNSKQLVGLQAKIDSLGKIVDGIIDSINIIDPNFQIIYQNKKSLTVFGEQLGEFCYQVFEHQTQVCANCPVARVYNDGESHTAVRKIVFDRGTAYMEVTASPIKDASGIISSVVEVARSITDRKLGEDLIFLQAAALQASMDGIALLNREGEYIYLNDAHAQIYGYSSPVELHGETWKRLYDQANLEYIEQEVMPELAKKGQWRGEAVGRKRDGSKFPQEISLVLIKDEGMVCVVRDITERKETEKQLAHHAYHDPLTNLPNRMLFNERFNLELSHASRNNKSLAVLFLDLDHFKLVNDMLGHAVGDWLLNEVTNRLKSCVRESDTISRLGGDEFTLLLPELNYAEDAVKIARKIIQAFEQPWLLNGQDYHITTSIGIAIYPDDGTDADTLLKHADMAMYRAKEQGRNNYQIYTTAMNSKIMERLTLENSLYNALQRGELEVYYQPQVNTASREIIGMEALIRWNNPERGMILPDQFIPLAEETGLIIPIGEWVLRTACAQNKAWHNKGYSTMRVTVNLSSRQFLKRNLVETVAMILAETNLEPQWLELEITESIAMQDVEFCIKTLQELRAMGVWIAIDDFGTGYSSLNYLKRFPVHTLKIDRSFVKDIINNPEDAAIVSTVIILAQNLNLNVTAEGVETKEQLKFLNQQLCHEMQGYLFGKPMRASEFEAVLSAKYSVE